MARRAVPISDDLWREDFLRPCLEWLIDLWSRLRAGGKPHHQTVGDILKEPTGRIHLSALDYERAGNGLITWKLTPAHRVRPVRETHGHQFLTIVLDRRGAICGEVGFVPLGPDTVSEKVWSVMDAGRPLTALIKDWADAAHPGHGFDLGQCDQADLLVFADWLQDHERADDEMAAKLRLIAKTSGV
jgi:hypothetical protein